MSINLDNSWKVFQRRPALSGKFRTLGLCNFSTKMSFLFYFLTHFFLCLFFKISIYVCRFVLVSFLEYFLFCFQSSTGFRSLKEEKTLLNECKPSIWLIHLQLVCEMYCKCEKHTMRFHEAKQEPHVSTWQRRLIENIAIQHHIACDTVFVFGFLF